MAARGRDEACTSLGLIREDEIEFVLSPSGHLVDEWAVTSRVLRHRALADVGGASAER